MINAADEGQQAVMYHGHCTCNAVHFSVNKRPLFVHCCHCTWCQRETGSAFAVNLMIETSNVRLLAGTVEEIQIPSLSGSGQQVVRCAACRVALWSHYGARRRIAYVRVGTLDEAHRLPPDVHIFTSTKQPWVRLPEDASAFAEYYDPEQHWPSETKQRFKKLKAANA